MEENNELMTQAEASSHKRFPQNLCDDVCVCLAKFYILALQIKKVGNL